MVFNGFVGNVAIYLPSNFEASQQLSSETYNASLANTSYVSDRIINETVSVPNLKEYYTTRGEDLRHINHPGDGKIATTSGASISYLEYLPYIQILQQTSNTTNKPQTLAQNQHQPQQAHQHHQQANQLQQHQQTSIQTISQMHQVNQKPAKSRKKAHQNQIRIPNYDGIDPTSSTSTSVTTTSGQTNSNRNDILQGSSTKRLYFCPLCNKMFKWARNLKRHQIVHTGEEPYKCTKCRRSFKTNYRRKLHEKIPHPLRYGCTLCLNQFLKEGELKTHLKNHHGITD